MTSLLDAARAAAANAYAPYSRFPVGAALRAADGTVTTGFNVENTSYSLCLCAERVAMVAALTQGKRDFTALAVCGGTADNPATPCGACRQFLAEFLGATTPVIYAGLPAGSPPRQTTLGALLPEAFKM